MGGFYTPRQGM